MAPGAHLYLHASRHTSQWDTCAPDIILHEAGCRLTDSLSVPFATTGLKRATSMVSKRKSCAYCGGSVQAVADVIERAVEHALRKGAKIEVVTGEACASLNTVGGIGAFLKARAVSL